MAIAPPCTGRPGGLQGAYPRLQATQELFEIDRRRITCAGGTASIDLMLDLIAQAHGSELAVQVSEQFVLGRIRPRQDHQRMQIASRYGMRNKKLVQVIGEMERNTELPLNTQVLAEAIRSPGASWSGCSACTWTTRPVVSTCACAWTRPGSCCARPT
jgi:AraC family carnitine catabolism transcriptional activator